MDNLTIITTTLFIVENLLLITAYLIWLKRKCQHCQKVKCLEQIFNKLCATCIKKNPKKSSNYEI